MEMNDRKINVTKAIYVLSCSDNPNIINDVQDYVLNKLANIKDSKAYYILPKMTLRRRKNRLKRKYIK